MSEAKDAACSSELVALTDEQRNDLAEFFHHARIDAVLGDDGVYAEDFARSFLAIIRFCDSVGIKFTASDMDYMLAWLDSQEHPVTREAGND